MSFSVFFLLPALASASVPLLTVRRHDNFLQGVRIRERSFIEGDVLPQQAPVLTLHGGSLPTGSSVREANIVDRLEELVNQFKARSLLQSPGAVNAVQSAANNVSDWEVVLGARQSDVDARRVAA